MSEEPILERRARRHALAKIENLIRQLPTLHLESSDLKTACIRHLSLSLEGDDTQHHPRFFKPYLEKLPLPGKEAEDKLPGSKPDPDHIMWETRRMKIFLTGYFRECWEYAWREYPHNPPPSGGYAEIGQYKFGQLLECIGSNWYAVSVTDYPKANYTHFKAMLESEAIGNNNQLLRGEIITIANIMAARLRTRSLRPHIIAPILAISLMGPRHARVLEADFDGEILTIRASKLYDFTEKNTDAAQLLTGYWMGGACGGLMQEGSYS